VNNFKRKWWEEGKELEGREKGGEQKGTRRKEGRRGEGSNKPERVTSRE
jgi:hypothetical protein